MRILMLGWEFPPHNSGGLGVACQGLARALCGDGEEVIFVLPKKADITHDIIRFRFADVSNVRMRGVDIGLAPYMTSREYAFKRRLAENMFYGSTLFEEVFRYAQLIESIVEDEEFDIIHAHDWLSFLAGARAKEVSGKPLVVHVHATEFDRSGGLSADSRVYEIEKHGMEIADAVIAVSQFTKNIIVRHYGIDPDKIYVAHNGISAEEFSEDEALPNLFLKKPGQKLVLFVGRITIQKGPDYFLRAAKRVLQYCPNTIFVIAGSGDMEHQVVREAADLGIADKVFFSGFVRGRELKKLYAAADLFVLPSVSEPFGITVLESLVNGTPVLISKQSGVSEVVKNALKVNFWDIDEMADKIIAVLTHKPLSHQLREYGGREARAATWQKAARTCRFVYREVMQFVKDRLQ